MSLLLRFAVVEFIRYWWCLQGMGLNNNLNTLSNVNSPLITGVISTRVRSKATIRRPNCLSSCAGCRHPARATRVRHSSISVDYVIWYLRNPQHTLARPIGAQHGCNLVRMESGAALLYRPAPWNHELSWHGGQRRYHPNKKNFLWMSG